MALEFARSNVLSRSAGHSAVKAAAYRAGEKLRDDRIGRTADYSHRSGEVGHSEILLPEGASPEFEDRQTLWAAVENREDQHNRRASAQLAIDNVIALPVELSKEQHIEIATSFARKEYVSRGLVVDLAIHYHSDGNPHAHLMTTTRPLKGREFGAKDRGVAGKFYGGAKIADEVQLRHRWADFQNTYFKEKGLDVSITNHNGEYQAEKHLGPAKQLHEKGIDTALYEAVQEIRSAREQAILDRPEIIIDRVADKKAVFTKHDLYRELNKVVKSQEAFAEIKAKLDVHESLVTMKNGKSKGTDREYLTTIGNLRVEHTIRLTANRLAAEDEKFAIKQGLREAVLADYAFLSNEQKEAVKHLTGKERLGLVMGLAGAGKSTMLEAVRRINAASDREIHGVALAGKAADELQKSSGIPSRTISSFLYGVESGRIELKAGDVLVVDELGMVSNKQAVKLLAVAEKAGMKVIGVGDTEQLQSIQSGAVLRDLSKRHGYAGIETIRRQTEQWQRDATFALAKGRANEAISAYADRGQLHRGDSSPDGNAVTKLVNDYLGDGRVGTKAVLAHRRDDVKSLNEGIREGMIDKGLLGTAKPFLANTGRDEQRLVFDLEPGDEVVFKIPDRGLGIGGNDTGTFVGGNHEQLNFVHNDGRELSFSAERYCEIDIPDKVDIEEKINLAAGDRVLFTRNDREVGVKNGQLGTVLSYSGGNLSVEIDSGDRVNFRQEDYSDIAHGYATTVHKSQGMTVDHSYFLGNESLDKHLAYVGMSRHRESMDIYTDDESRFRYAVSRDNRQETALDFAETKGLEMASSAHADTLDRIIKGKELEVMAVENIVGTISEQDYQRATALLKAEQTRIASQLEQNAKQPLVELEKRVGELDARLQEKQGSKPKPGLIKTKGFQQKEMEWKHEVSVLTAERKNVVETIDSMQSGKIFAENQKKIQDVAARRAEMALPKESAIADGFRADVRIGEINTKLTELDKSISVARTKGDEDKLPQLLKSKSNLLNSLQHRESLQVRLNGRDKIKIRKAMKATTIELGLFKSRGLELGR